MSTRRTRSPVSASAPARLIAVVVLPTPPFWLAMAITCGKSTTSGDSVSRPGGPAVTGDAAAHATSRRMSAGGRVVHTAASCAPFCGYPGPGRMPVARIRNALAMCRSPAATRRNSDTRRRSAAGGIARATRAYDGRRLARRCSAGDATRRSRRTCPTTRNGSRASSACATEAALRAGERRGSSASTRWASSPRASGSTCCSTRARSSELDAFVTHRAAGVRARRAARPRRRRRHRARHDRRPAGVRVLAGLHGLRRIAVGGVRREDLQGDGPRDEGRRAGHRPQRLRRRADPGGRRVARRVRRDLPAQRPGVRRRAADLGDPRAVRRRRGVLAGDDRLHRDGRGDELHVRHRARTS